MKKKILAGLMCLTMMTMVGCSTKETTTTPESSQSEEGATKTYSIGISQFAEHGSLDNCKEGFLEGLVDAGFVEGKNLTITFENAQADTGIAGQIANNLVSNKVDLICAIATPSAASAYNVAMKADIPVVYTAITDPIGAGFANEDGSPVGEITGTSDKLPVEQQLQMIREILPEAKTIGIIYTTSEVNSEASIKEYEELVGDYGFTLETVGISTLADVPLAVDSLLPKVDCINNLTDNTVVQGLATVVGKANVYGKPVFGSEVEQVKNGCLAAVGIEYYDLGVQTGLMAGKILKGEAKASEMNFELITQSGLYINSAVAEKLDISIDSGVIEKAIETFDTIAE